MTKKYPSDEQDRFLVRLPAGMRQQIADIAKANGRSMNSEIVARLEASLGKGDGNDHFGEAISGVVDHLMDSPKYKAAIERMRADILSAIPELAHVDYVDGKPVKKK